MSFYFSKDLLQRFNEKEPGAQLRVYNEYYTFVYGVVRKITAGSDYGKDITANIFFKLFHYPGVFANAAKLKYFLYRVTRNACLDYLRRQRTEFEHHDNIVRQTEWFEENDFEELEAKAILDKKISDSIEELPRRCRYIFKLYYYQHLNNEQIAAKLSIEEKTVANQKTNAFRILKIKISKLNGASVTVFMSLYQWVSHLHHFFRLIRSVWC